MPVTHVHKEPERLAMTITSEFTAPVERVWRLWEDPRLLERWWGPPTYPATVVDHALTTGGSVTYFMTGPEGDQHHGWWKVRAVDAPRQLEFEDGFADDDGTPNLELPTTVTQVRIEERAGGGTTMTIATTFPTLEAMEQMISMGMEEGMQQAMGQIDHLLAA